MWSADCNGHFTTGDGRYGAPLTSTEGSSRFLRSGQALSSTSVAAAQPVFTRVFRAFGRPQRSRTDHGVPFATNTLGQRSPLSAWWVRLGLLPECIEPGKPPQNGRHERMQRTVTADTTRPPGANLRPQQQQCTRFREAFNHARPHEALDMRPPAACDAPSPRQRPHQRPPLADPDRFEGRDVSAHGGIRWNHPWGNVSPVCVGAYVGLEAIDDGVWHVDGGPLNLGRFLERHMRLEEASGRLPRRR